MSVLIYDIKVYNKTLTPEEIRDVYNGIDFEIKYKREKTRKIRKEKLEKINDKWI